MTTATPRTALVYAVTGSASGMGNAAAAKLRALGHTVIGVDIRDAEVVADLSTSAGRRTAAEAVLAACGGHLDGAVLAAGLGPTAGAERAMTEVNYFGVVDLLTAWRPALAAAYRAKVVVFSSNSTTTVPAVPGRAVRALLAGDADKALRAYRIFGRFAPPIAYAASKIAVSRWVRRNATTPEWAGAGIRLNALAPGAILTPLLQRQLATPADAKNIRRFPVPIAGLGERCSSASPRPGDNSTAGLGERCSSASPRPGDNSTAGFGDPGQLADWVLFMLSDSAEFLCGSIVFVDGGSDAYYRPDDWPRAVPARRLVSYLRRTQQFSRRSRS